jgi:predicted nucleic acid-binding Zn ribbon protein
MNGERWQTASVRDLTREERAAIHTLVVKYCANYQRQYGCLPLDGECYMLLKWWTGADCKYFDAAVLPLDPALLASLTGGAVDLRPCALCGQPFRANGKQAYCSANCAAKAQRKRNREHMRKKRR